MVAEVEPSQALAGNPHNAIVQLVQERRTGPGPLSGVPVVVKDLIDVAGVPTRCGSTVLADAPPAREDAAVVALLRAAGAVVLAKSHTHEFGYGPTGDVAASGPCRNPHDPQRITGGSSSGTAALCGVVGLKPARDVLPTTGVFPLSETLDHVALLGTDVGMVATAFSALTGRRVNPAAPLSGTVIGRPTDPYWQVHDPEIAAAVERAAGALSTAGAVLREIRMPGINEFAATYRVIVGVEAFTTHRHWLAQRPGDYQPATAARLRIAADYTAADYVTAQRTRRRLVAELTARMITGGIDLLLTPATPLRSTPIGARQVSAPDGTPVDVAPALLSLTLPFNLLGWPAVSVPAPDVTGLPVGVQLAAVRGGEQAVLAAGTRIANGGSGPVS